MPEMHFHVRWPDGRREACYSPSLVIKEHFGVGETYAVADFVARSRTALTIASARVEARYGFPCSLALGQLARIEARASALSATPDARVTVEAFEE
ncbi:hypothetical protein MBUL_00646 [Methylobacterium bullatum]|uniref:MSMEG_0570 family nitrogen starvation response protein n=1 Tax=Methylobacterium bullatum TaxID=570505 RepID=A0A679IU43_9HYPH|nr:hypothetical protein MBUL_00646 [Methylobacterium bullatum]